MVDIDQSINLVRMKFKALDEKIEAMGDITDHFHESTEKLEDVYLNEVDLAKRDLDKQMNA